MDFCILCISVYVDGHFVFVKCVKSNTFGAELSYFVSTDCIEFAVLAENTLMTFCSLVLFLTVLLMFLALSCLTDYYSVILQNGVHEIPLNFLSIFEIMFILFIYLSLRQIAARHTVIHTVKCIPIQKSKTRETEII